MNNLLSLLTLTVSSLVWAIGPFELPQMNMGGGVYRSSDHKDAVFVVEAFKDKDHDSTSNEPNIDLVAEFFKSEPRVQVLYVGSDMDKSDYFNWVWFHKPKQRVLDDSNKTLLSQLAISKYPTLVIIDAKGNIAHKIVGPMWYTSDFKSVIEKIKQLLRNN